MGRGFMCNMAALLVCPIKGGWELSDDGLSCVVVWVLLPSVFGLALLCFVSWLSSLVSVVCLSLGGFP